MKKIWLLAIASALTIGGMAKDRNHGKRKCKSCTEKVCKPACKGKVNCASMHCDKG